VISGPKISLTQFCVDSAYCARYLDFIYFSLICVIFCRHMLSHSDVREFKCPHCSFEGKLLGHLKRHLRLHTGVKPFSCPYCNFKANVLVSPYLELLITANESRYRLVWGFKFLLFRFKFPQNK